ncbi:hypothetical protein [uncultured Desulfosarcina sp.]|uniref:hypothetical protein n=1 Tax=uncultured Desulfosarcina sp. TaxID=218289 RepID=UPI0029C8B70B|nr:hypothetical protein [uncultured Desulfosarcina sp.]
MKNKLYQRRSIATTGFADLDYIKGIIHAPYHELAKIVRVISEMTDMMNSGGATDSQTCDRLMLQYENGLGQIAVLGNR